MTIAPIITIGELLVDWVSPEPGLKDHKIYNFKMAAGGAPANVAIGLAKLGYPSYFVGGVSDDSFGTWLFDYLESSGVATDLVQKIPQSCTRHAYIFTTEDGNRVLSHITSNQCPDSLLQSKLLDAKLLAQASIVYYGSVMQSTLQGAKNVDEILALIPSNALRIYDPNIRTCLWTQQMERLQHCLEQSAQNVDILKLSDNELQFFTDELDEQTAAQIIFERYQPALLIVTLGAKGAMYLSSKGQGLVKSFQVSSVEMTGAGDGFIAGLLGGFYALAQLENQSIKETVLSLTSSEIEALLLEANAVGALATTQPGATAGLPTQEQLKDFLEKHHLLAVAT